MNQLLQVSGVIFLALIAVIAFLLVTAWIHETWTAIVNYPKAKHLKAVVDEQREELDRRSHRILQLEAELEQLRPPTSKEEDYEGLLQP